MVEAAPAAGAGSRVCLVCGKPGVSGSGMYMSYCAEHNPKKEAKADPAPKAAAKKPMFGVTEKCSVCGKSAYANESVRVNGHVHEKCFKCSHCGKSLSLSDYGSDQGKLFCSYHFKKITYGKHYDV